MHYSPGRLSWVIFHLLLLCYPFWAVLKWSINVKKLDIFISLLSDNCRWLSNLIFPYSTVTSEWIFYRSSLNSLTRTLSQSTGWHLMVFESPSEKLWILWFPRSLEKQWSHSNRPHLLSSMRVLWQLSDYLLVVLWPFFTVFNGEI